MFSTVSQLKMVQEPGSDVVYVNSLTPVAERVKDESKEKRYQIKSQVGQLSGIMRPVRTVRMVADVSPTA